MLMNILKFLFLSLLVVILRADNSLIAVYPELAANV